MCTSIHRFGMHKHGGKMMTTQFQKTIRKIFKNPGLVIGVLVLSFFVLVAVFAPLIAPYAPDEMDLGRRLLSPGSYSKAGTFHLFGTDSLGCDILSKTIYGTRVSLLVGFLGAVLAGVVGTILGSMAGFFGGAVDEVIMRVVDIGLSIPFVLLAMSISMVMGAGLLNVVIVLCLTGWMQFARVTRGAALKIKQEVYIEAARAYQCPPARIICRHLIPNLMAPIIVICSQQFGVMIYSEATLSFLGFGVPIGTATWGRMISDGQSYIASSWWISTVPGIVLTLVVIAAFLLGDGMRDYLDPRLNY